MSSNNFEKKRGILTCAEKSVITTVGKTVRGHLEVDDGESIVRYPYLTNQSTTKILGLHITPFSFTASHVKEISTRARTYLTQMKGLRHLSIKGKTQLTKSLILTTLTYPCIPLNTCSVSRLLQLQAIQNDALRWIYNVRHTQRITNRELHHRANLLPLNQVIHSRARILWEKLRAGEAGDRESFERISSIDVREYFRYFPSSLDISLKEDPPPIYTPEDCKSQAVKDFYAHSPNEPVENNPDDPDDPP